MKRAFPLWAFAALGAAALAAWLPVPGLGLTSDSFLLPFLLDGKGSVDWGRVAADLTGPWMNMRGGVAWRPFVTLHYAWDLSLFGVCAPGLHLSNLVFHLAAGLGVFAILRKILPREGIWAAWVGAFLYLVHPARAEAVAWIAGRVDTTPALPAVLSLLVFLRAGEREGKARAGWTLLSLLLALLAYAGKEMALALPASFFFVEFLRPKGPGKGRPFFYGGILPHLLLFAGVLAWRVHVLGSLAAGNGAGTLAASYLSTLPGKFRAAFLPPPPGRIPAWAGLLCWGLLPLGAGLLRGRRFRLVFLLLLWWGLLLVPAAGLEVFPDWSGSRVLLFPALPAAALAALLLGPPAKGRDLWPLGSLRWIAGGGLLALALAGLLFRLQDWKVASDLADRTIQAVEARAPVPGKGPLGLAHLPSRPGHVPPFRWDCAFLAFRPPFVKSPRDVLVLENATQPPLLDAGPLHVAGRFCRALLAWEPARGRFVDLKVPRRGRVPLSLEGIRGRGKGVVSGPGGLALDAPGWTWLTLPGQALPFQGVEGMEILARGASPGLKMVLAWAPPGKGKEAFRGDPSRLGPLFSCPLYPLGPGRRRWIGASGNRMGFFALSRWGRPIPVALAVKGKVRLVSLAWLDRLPRLEWNPPAGWVLDPEHPLFPVPPGLEGPGRLVLLTPSEVLVRLVKRPGKGPFLLDREGRALLEFLRGLLPEGRVYFYWERLARASDPGSVLERSLPASARLGTSSTGAGKRSYPSTTGGASSEKERKIPSQGGKGRGIPHKEKSRK